MKFGVREICNVVFKALKPVTIGDTTFLEGQPVLYIDTAKTSTLEGAATTVYAEGGRGNAKLLAWEGEKTLTFTIEDALLSPLGFSILSGAGLMKGASDVIVPVHTTANVVATVADTITLDADALGMVDGDTITISNNAAAKVYGTIVDAEGAVVSSAGVGTIGAGHIITAGGETPTSVTVTFGTGSVPVGSIVLVDFYVEKTTSVQTMTIDAGNFAGYYYVEASTLLRDAATGEDLPAEITIPKAKIQSNFTFDMAATGDPSTFKFTMDAFPAPTRFNKSKKVLCAIQVIDDSEG